MSVFNIHTVGRLPGAVYIGRPSKFGNPFVIGKDGNRAQVIEKYRAYLNSRPDLVRAAVAELRGKDLLCYCAPAPCHGDVLHVVANMPLPPNP
jgi:hypothetical protein